MVRGVYVLRCLSLCHIPLLPVQVRLHVEVSGSNKFKIHPKRKNGYDYRNYRKGNVHFQFTTKKT